MKKNTLLIIDDVHLEGRPPEMCLDFAEIIKSKLLAIKDSGDNPILICAGDISENDAGMEWVKQFDCDTIYVCGNHEFWNNDYYEVIENLKKKSKQPGFEKIKFLHNDEAIINGTRFIGATIWSDLGKSWAWIKRNYVLKHFFSMADFRKITAKQFYNNQKQVDEMFRVLTANGIDEEQITNLISKQLYNPYLQMEENQKSIEYIEDKIIEAFDGETVVVSHHLPIPDFWMEVNNMNEQILSAPHINNKSIYEKYLKQKIEIDKDILMMGFYVNTAYQFFEHNFSPDIWVHGHFHKSVDGFLGTTRIVSSPVGYMKQSTELKIKEVKIGHKLEYFVSNAINLLNNYDWDRKIISTIKAFQLSLNGIISSYEEDTFDEDNIKPIITSFKKQHETGLKEVEKFVSNILYNLIKIINKEIEVPDHLYVTSYVSGFSRWAATHRILGIEPFNFTVNEDSFMPENKFKKLPQEEKQKLFHYSQWLETLDRIMEEPEIFKNALVSFLEETLKDPKIEENYINNID